MINDEIDKYSINFLNKAIRRYEFREYAGVKKGRLMPDNNNGFIGR
jgi:hypothetical protein